MASTLISSIIALSTTVASFFGCSSSREDGPSSAGQPQGIGEDLERLNRTLTWIQGVLRDAEEREINDRTVRLWLSELRGVACAAEDVLDEYYYEVRRSIIQQSMRATKTSKEGAERKTEDQWPLLSPSTIVGEVSVPDGMADKIKTIIERLDEISKARGDLHLRECDGEQRVIGSQKRPPTTSYVDEMTTLGREHEQDELINLLISESDAQFVVIPVVGMAGVGKTVLAQLVYNDQRVKTRFNHRAWVSVNAEFDVLCISKAIVESITKKPCDFTEFSMIQKNLRQKLKGQSLLVVLDDVWNENQSLWQLFKSSFARAKSVKIITTCRSTSAARIMQTMSPYCLGFLPEEQCWMLFKHYAFGNEKPDNYGNLVEIGHKLVKKCDCLPLAVKALAALLQYEKDEQRWREVLESDIWELDEEKIEILPALRLSYHHLPLHLRSCFCYISMHPKGAAFEKDDMIRQWMAQGYIQPHSRKTLEDIGSEFFDELQCRSLIEQVDNNRFRVHDLVHDLARSISQSTGFMSYNERSHMVSTSCCAARTLLNCRFNSSFNYDSFVLKMVSLRVLVLSTDAFELRDIIGTLKHLRFLCIDGRNLKRLPGSICDLYNLQTLDLQICSSLLELPREIGNLIELQYLRLYSLHLKHLPESICQLCNLHTLDLDGCYRLCELPSGIRQLRNLRKLYVFYSSIKCLPPGIGMLCNIHIFVAKFEAKVDDRKRDLRELKNLNNLGGTLCICGIQNVSNVEHLKVVDLRSKAKLRKLKLTWRNAAMSRLDNVDEGQLHVNLISSNVQCNYANRELQKILLESLQPHSNLVELSINGYMGTSFPAWLSDPSSLSRLTTVTLESCRMEEINLAAFGVLPSLRNLSLVDISVENVGDLLYRISRCPSETRFASLVNLEFRGIDKLELFDVLNDDFPCLKRLLIIDCPKLQKIQIIPDKVEWLEMSTCGCREIFILPQSKLRRLNIRFCKELSSIHMPESGHEFLNQIILVGCPKVKVPTIPDNLQQLLVNDCGSHEISIDTTPQSKLQDIRIMLCKELCSINVSGGEFSSLKQLSIMGCHKLQHFPTIPSELKKLEISHCNCREIQIPPDCKLQVLSISHCGELASILGLHELTAIRSLSLVSCPLLQITVDMLGSKPDKFEVHNWPVLEPQQDGNGPDDQQRMAAFDKLVLSGDHEFHLSDGKTIRLTGHIYGLVFATQDSQEDKGGINIPFLNSLSYQIVKVDTLWLVELEICNCNKVIMLHGLSNLVHLKFLLLVECPQLRYWTDRHLPTMLISMVIVSCDMLSSLPPLDENLRSLEVLEIWKCSKLKTIQGLHCLTSLKTLKIINCSEICISLAERLQVRLRFGTIRNCPWLIHWCRINNIPFLQVNKRGEKDWKDQIV